MPDDRRRSPGRRESDRILDALWRELDALNTNTRRDLERLERTLERRDERVDRRVDELEAFHIAERTRIGERIVERDAELQRRRDRLSERLGRWAIGGYVVGLLGLAWGITVTVFHL